MTGRYLVIMVAVVVLANDVTSSPFHSMLFRAKMAKRSIYDNRIDPLPVHPRPAVPSIGEQMLDEFITYLSLKETGLLDLCIAKKK